MNRVESAICRIRQKLPGNEGFVTLGSGCIVRCQHLASKCGWKNPNIILTSNSVLTKEALSSDRVFVADFISNEKKGLETFDLRLAAETCKQIARHELPFDSSAKTNGSYVNDNDLTASLTAISVEHLDKRSFLKRMVKKSSLQTSRPIECYGGDDKSCNENLMCDGFLYCLVLCEKPSRQKNTNDFETQTFKCTYNRESKQVLLEHFGGGTCLQYAKDFSDEDSPYGAVISSKKGEFVGVLDFNKDGIFPLFVPPGSSVEEKVVNNNLDRSSTSEAEGVSEGDHESVETDKEPWEVNHKSVATDTEPHAAEENTTEGSSAPPPVPGTPKQPSLNRVIKENLPNNHFEMPEGASAQIERSLKPATVEVGTEQGREPGSDPTATKYHERSAPGEADSKVSLSEEADNHVSVSDKADASKEAKLETQPYSIGTGVPEERASETNVQQSESQEIVEPTDKLEQNESIQLESTDQVKVSECQRELEGKSPVEELESPKEQEIPAPQIGEEQRELLESEMVEQQNMTVERTEPCDSQVTQSESQSEKLLAFDMVPPAISASQEETENATKVKEEKKYDTIEKTVSQTMPQEVELSVKNVPEQNNSDSFAEASDNVPTLLAVGTSDNTEEKNLEPENMELSSYHPAPEMDSECTMLTVIEAEIVSDDKEPGSSLETEFQPEGHPSSEGRIVPINTEEPEVQAEGIPSVAEIQDDRPEAFDYGYNLQAAPETDNTICSGTELNENNLDLQQVETSGEERTLSIDESAEVASDLGATTEGKITETPAESEIEFGTPTDTTEFEVSNEVPEIELGSPTDTTEVEENKEVPEIEFGSPTDTTEVEVSKDVTEIEFGSPTDTTEFEVSKEVQDIELDAPTETTVLKDSKDVPEIELGSPTDTTEFKMSKEVPEIELGLPTDTTEFEVSKEVPEIEFGSPTDTTEVEVSKDVTEIEFGSPTDTTEFEVSKEVQDIELDAPTETTVLKDSKDVPEIELGSPTDTTEFKMSKEVPEIELGLPTVTTEFEVSKEVPEIEFGSPTDTTEVEVSKDVTEIEFGSPTDTTEFEVSKEVQDIELDAPTETTVLKDSKDVPEIELGSPTDTTEFKMSKEVPEIELGLPTDTTEFEVSKEVPEIELGSPTDTTEVEESKEVQDIELGAPTETTVLKDSKDVPKIELEAPPEIELRTPMDTTDLEEGKEAPGIELGSPTAIELGASTEIELGAPTEIELGAPTEIELGAPTEIELGAPTEIELGAPTEIELGAPMDSVVEDSKKVAEIELGVSMDTMADESKEAPAIDISEPLVAPAVEEESKSVSKLGISEPVGTEETESNKEVPATELGDPVVTSVVEEESKEEARTYVRAMEAESKDTTETQLVTPVVSMADILVSEKVEDTTLLKTASGEEGNILAGEESPADAKSLAEDSKTQEVEETEDTADTEIPKILVDLVAPEIVADAVDSAGQENGRADAQADKSSREEIPCNELGNDLGICVRSLSDMNVTIRRLDTDTLLIDVVTNDPVVSEELGRHLDIEYRHGHVACWRDVADLLAIPPALYEHCLMYSKSSPTEDLFAFLAAAKPDTTMHDIKDILKTMERVDVVQTIDKYLARSGLKDDIVAGTLVEKDEEYILERISLKLDKFHPQNWKALAAGLDIPRKVFRNFGSQHEHNSALLLLKYLPIFDPELSVAMLKDTLDEIDRSDVVQVLNAAGIPDNDQIKDILDDVELMDQVSDLLNEEGLVDGKTWRHLAKELGVPKEKRRIFEPAGDRPSPTKLLLKSVETFDPDITVEELILALVAMKRHDVLEALKKYFESEDIHKILDENNLLPPSDDSTCSRLEAEEEREYTDSDHEGNDIED